MRDHEGERENGEPDEQIERAFEGEAMDRGARLAHSWRSWGSSLTRSQSPRRLADSTISMMQHPGSTVSHQYPAIRPFFPSASMRPQAGSGGGTPTPRKDSAASVTMTTPSMRVPSTMAEFSTLGR